MKADLHLHTYYSDGTESPSQVVERAALLKFNFVAITDHDTVEGIPEALEAGRYYRLNIVPGVEITAQFRGQELHLLAYFKLETQPQSGWQDPELTSQLKQYVQHREERARKIVKRLNDLGVAVTIEEVCHQATLRRKDKRYSSQNISIGRPHIAAALVAGNYVSSISEAFSKFLKKDRPAWVDKERVDAAKIIHLVHRCGGIMALAHPGLLHDEKIPSQLLEKGIDGVEVYHSRHTPTQSVRLRNWAEENNLLITGGSDCHGMLKGEPLLGRVELKDTDLEHFLKRLQ